ncbi:MAG: NADH-quinone oxidoreductase subunit J [Dehalococcoidales bacterium]|nr:NADH-quinone oxidoreductase subunit J [Dehalococcoidales bacterium]
MGQVIAFWILAVTAVSAALGVVLLRNIFRAAMLLVLGFLAIAGVYILLNADFLAAIQVLIYIGAIGILIILAIMLTREVTIGSPSNKLQIPALIIVILLFVGIGYAIFNTQWQITNLQPDSASSTSTLAIRLFGKGGFILPLEIIPILLLATVISAIVLVKAKK